MDRLEAMRLFVRVAELGSFSSVAQQLGAARSVVTRQIAALEKHLGVKLMARSTRRLTLTSAGAAYLEKCRVILNLVETAESDVGEERQAPRGAIRVSVPLSYGIKRLAPLLLDFADQYPDVGLAMDFSDRRSNLIEEGIDLAIRITARMEPGDVARRLATERLIVVAAPDYLARHGAPLHPADLIHHECLGYTVTARHNWQFLIDGKFASFPVRYRLSASNGDVLADAAARSLGIACQPQFISADYLADGRLQQILAEFPLPELGVYAVLPGNRYIPHRVRVLMDWLANRISGRPA
jgi:DNA-binding transcriptional LysR family regulator